MKRTRLTLATVSILLFCIVSQAQEKWSRVKIFVPDDNAAMASLIGKLHIDHFDNHQDGSIISEISQSELQMLATSGYTYQIWRQM